jgi:DnaJ-domain-containing protein 1
MSFLDDIFSNKKKEEKERLHQERQAALDANMEKTTKVQEQNVQVQGKNLEIQKSAMEIAWKNQEQSEKLTKLVLDNERTKNLLLERENKIKEIQDQLDERQKEIRREEIEITARKAEVRKNEQLATEQLKKLEAESKSVVDREKEAEKVKAESETSKEKYQALYDELEVDKGNIKTLEEEARRKNKDADEKTATANAIFEKSKVIDEEIKAKEAKFEEHRESIEKALKDKIEEYDRRLADLDAVKGIVDDVKFDDSEDGQQAKIVVKEAIRQAKKSLSDIKTRFDELDDKYASGTFKGFSTPLTEIDKDFEELKSQYIQIQEHIAANDSLPPSVSKWLSVIEDCIANAELLLNILMDWAGADSEEQNETEEDDFTDWYIILEVDIEATYDEIKKQFRILIKKYHPDKAPPEKQEEYHKISAELNEAYDILCDEAKRKAFDEKRNKRKNKK